MMTDLRVPAREHKIRTRSTAKPATGNHNLIDVKILGRRNQQTARESLEAFYIQKLGKH